MAGNHWTDKDGAQLTPVDMINYHQDKTLIPSLKGGEAP